ncbi:MAG: hemerythrin domain-containing protein [Candidatus Margulisbacteria bacterium]|nr:hemerythrin domain-containing protein [Candidatus Margulisiibacteriota bacterium]MBU1021601.1 hemerythrin domain-containing protein [Candidatus Margulisiibacteriota bacterium]MBU1728752.1 hemerythrin domain-containing protein [Candidatus Margulisiibacteriota bacterium]MBU1955718.1 hemerythrin domain-containing protein [Candidatus Margulisiibacteriota bacterium]
MMPAGPLMTEHRLIERMIARMDRELDKIKKESLVDVGFIEVAVDFLRSYADRCHHGKEEDILFKALSGKPLSAEHKRIMEELIREHVLGRGNVRKLKEANESYAQGNQNALSDVVANLEILVKFYPKHIEKEDKHFFIPAMDYFDKKEQATILEEFWEFDKKLIHEKYNAIVKQLEKQTV